MSATASLEVRGERSVGLPLIELARVEKVYRTGKLEYPALRGVDLTIGAALKAAMFARNAVSAAFS